jgi:hypothetical protein
VFSLSWALFKSQKKNANLDSRKRHSDESQLIHSFRYLVIFNQWLEFSFSNTGHNEKQKHLIVIKKIKTQRKVHLALTFPKSIAAFGFLSHGYSNTTRKTVHMGHFYTNTKQK